MPVTSLIVEASPRRRLWLEERIRGIGLFDRIQFCNDWAEAGRRLQEGGVDSLIADGESLAGNGLRGLATLNRLEEASSVPTLVFVSEADQGGRLRALENGAWDCLDHATPKAEIAARLRRHLENRRRIEELRQVREVLSREASTDALTGLFNRRHFQAALEAETARSSRHRESFALLMVDIDHFKRINDCCGHTAGDAVLRAVAGAIGAAVRRYDTLCRFGGEEFVLLMPKANQSNALRVAGRIARQVAALTQLFPGLPGGLTVSIGVSHFTGSPGTTPERLIEEADAALYLAKRQGRNRVELYSSELPLRSTPSQQVA